MDQRIKQAIADFRTIVKWLDTGAFDRDACRTWCLLAIDSLEGKGRATKGPETFHEWIDRRLAEGKDI